MNIVNTKHISKLLTLAIVILLVSIKSSAFTLLGTQWDGGRAVFRSVIFGAPSNAIPGNNFNQAYQQAFANWNNFSTFRFDTISAPANPCASSANSAAFSNTICGQAFGDSTLAVTRIQSFRGSTSRITIHFNNEIQWNVFSGSLFSRPGVDFRRVAIHELGHGLGLDHSGSRAAIMFPSIGNVDSIRTDDIAGTAALYDRDNDGIGEAFDNCQSVANPSQANADNDAFGDACDSDADNDGVGANDNCPLLSNTAQSDIDNDGIGDLCDTDIDGDGVSTNDNCPLLNNPDQSDVDQDGIGDLCDEDADNDGITIGDNCPLISNPEQTDSDRDDIGNPCDPTNELSFISSIILLLMGE